LNQPDSPSASDAPITRIAQLNVYPIKSCAGVALDEALLVETGVEFDRITSKP
jgi:uncharacterized protein YcbX